MRPMKSGTHIAGSYLWETKTLNKYIKQIFDNFNHFWNSFETTQQNVIDTDLLAEGHSIICMNKYYLCSNSNTTSLLKYIHQS